MVPVVEPSPEAEDQRQDKVLIRKEMRLRLKLPGAWWSPDHIESPEFQFARPPHRRRSPSSFVGCKFR